MKFLFHLHKAVLILAVENSNADIVRYLLNRSDIDVNIQFILYLICI